MDQIYYEIFLLRYLYYRQKMKQQWSTALIFVSLFIILAVLSLVLAPYATASNNIFLQTLVRGISIGSWVFLWEAIVGVTIKYRPNRMLYRRYKRLLNAKIIFINDHRNPRRPRSLPGSSKRRGTKQLRRDNIHKSG